MRASPLQPAVFDSGVALGAEPERAHSIGPARTVGFWAGLAAFASTVAFLFAQALQLFGVLRPPWDGILIYGFSLGIVVPFILMMVALHCFVPEDKKLWSQAALVFTIIYAVFVTANYVVQLATVIPVSPEVDAGALRVLSQTPHSLFWDFDAIGYIAMGLAMLFAAPVFARRGLQRRVKLGLLANALATPLIAIVYFHPGFSNRIFFLAFPWGITAPLSMLLLASFFRKAPRSPWAG